MQKFHLFSTCSLTG